MNSKLPESGVWKILIVDDEPEIHILTRTVLKDVTFYGKPLFFLSSYNAEGTKKIVREEDDIALILMDVVMEEDDTGLELIRYIREDLENRLTRIILRTGAPGEAPERRIIVDYEINDYKEKVDLTSPRLFTSVIKSLRNYRDLIRIQNINRELVRSREGLTKVITSSSELFESRTLENFYAKLLEQTAVMLDHRGRIILTGSFTGPILFTDDRQIEGKQINEVLSGGMIRFLEGTAKLSGNTYLEGDYFIGRLDLYNGGTLYIIADGCSSIPDENVLMLQIFLGNMSIVYNNLSLKEESQATQSEMIGLVGDAIENMPHEMYGHQTRVSEYAVILAGKLGFSDEDISVLKDAVKMHDTGKIGIYDSILDKPGPLSPEEYETMKNHTTIGYEILKSSSHKLLQMAAIIAWEHHERWDGFGYPRGLSGENIHRLGRITCIVDVFDALTTDRIYRKAWNFENTIGFIKEGRGTQFDPEMVDLFLEEKDRIREIMVRDNDKKDKNG